MESYPSTQGIPYYFGRSPIIAASDTLCWTLGSRSPSGMNRTTPRQNGVLSPPPLRSMGSGTSSPARPKFPVDHLRPYLKTVRIPLRMQSARACLDANSLAAQQKLNRLATSTPSDRRDFGLISSGVTWDPSDKRKMATLSKEISEVRSTPQDQGRCLPSSARTSIDSGQRAKQKMLEIEPKGFKYIVTTTLSENRGQAGR